MATPFGADDSSEARPLTLPGSSARPGKEAIFRAREAAYALANAPPGTPSGATPSLTSGQSIDPTQPPQAHASGPLQISTTTSYGSSSTPSATSSGKPGRRRQSEAPSRSSAGIAGVGAASGLPNTWAVEPEIIIQHRDGGTVQEIPPPYVDRSAGGSGGAGTSGAPSRPGPNVLRPQTGQSTLSTTQSMSEIDRESSRWSQGTLLGASGVPGPSGVAPGDPPIVHGAAGQSEP
ncbi:hypothetical protein BD410DRAFT_787210 [Rickenella mellea]|uniref:Uncharacterized protein n=1 Tax=Rickenella mellea TaxID=50990 RepID=A0A4Y7Q6X7_9AGAM|nr:hypothetical protein BD410DRAFT_787210 [Rickenella mellea]